VSNVTIHTTDVWWQRLRPRLIALYVLVALIVLMLSAIGHLRLLGEVDHTFGGFFWAVDSNNRIVVVSTPPSLPEFGIVVGSLTNQDYIVKVQVKDARIPGGLATYTGGSALMDAYQHVRPGDSVTYFIEHMNSRQVEALSRPALLFTAEMWWQNYGLALLAGCSWLVMGMILLLTAREWVGAVEAITLLPPAMLFLLYSHWGAVQQAYPSDTVVQFLWIPAFALLGAAFIHLSLTYRPEALSTPRTFRFTVDGLPYLPLVALMAFELSSYLLYGAVPTRPSVLLSLGYAVFGGILSLGIGVTSLVRISGLLPGQRVPEHVRRRLGDLLALWIGDVGLGFCLGILPILLTGRPLLPLQMFYVLAAIYPFLLWYAIRSLRLIDRLQVTLEQREEALFEQRKTAEDLRRVNSELEQATSLLLHADAHLRSLLSQRIHDQPKQQALRIRSLLGHWQHKLKVEAEQYAAGMVPAYPIIEALGKVRKISEELEDDLRGLQLLVEDVYQRRSLGLRLHLEKLIREDLPALHPESPLKVRADVWALDALDHDLEQTPAGEKVAEAISYAVTQALLNVYNHADASFATVRAVRSDGTIEIYIIDDGRGFDANIIAPEKTSLFKARLKTREAGGTLLIRSLPRPHAEHGTTIILRLPLPPASNAAPDKPRPESMVQNAQERF
jgi:anti-sigma regulatory factor (Ser/Thr protein kinase)